MTNILIIEDEPLAAQKLQRQILRLPHEVSIVGMEDAVKSSVEWLSGNKEPDLIFCDIQLGDGLSFEIFKHVTVECPIIFTTAFDEYAIQAFKLNSVDYLLKPIKEDHLVAAMNKYFKHHSHKQNSEDIIGKLQKAFSDQNQKTYKERFAVRIGEHIRLLEITDIALFESESKSTFIISNEGRHFPIEESLDQLEPLLDPRNFYRISRKHIVNYRAIADIIQYSSNRLRLVIKDVSDENILVSRERVKDFKKWLES